MLQLINIPFPSIKYRSIRTFYKTELLQDLQEIIKTVEET